MSTSMSRTSANPPEWSVARFATQATNRKLDNNVTSYVQVCVDGSPRATSSSAFRPKFKEASRAAKFAHRARSRGVRGNLHFKDGQKRAELKVSIYVENPPKSYTFAETTDIEVAMKCMIDMICAQCTICVHIETAYAPSIACIPSYSFFSSAHRFRYLSIPAW